ncbi:oxidoreductase [Amycolatopsis nigrescens]|uniref:oxidoreductase n=1 Tax=Amycolatopsis nigrescens TaxID=381445 RepID=UPI0003649341|nr:oxidoreductase [Amycolatopsis nigrescens]
MAKWTASDIPDQSGRTAVVTGANSGLGLIAAKRLAGAGAHVVLACRNVDKGKEAAAGMTGDVEVRQVDLASLASVRSFADSTTEQVDVLINNAGLMAVPRGRTEDGFDTQFGVNHLGHFALTGLLLGRITDRVVTMSSFMHRIGRIRLTDPNWSKGYRRWAAYGQSKLANLMFAYELQRRLAAAGSPVRAYAAHPGYSDTNLQGRTESIQDLPMGLANRLFAQPAERGALPSLYAATVPELPGGSFVGPDGPGELWGYPHRVRSNSASRDEGVQRRLWALSEELTGVEYEFAGPGR